MEKKNMASVDVTYKCGSLSVYDVEICGISMSDGVLTIPLKDKGYTFMIPLDDLKSLHIYK